MLRRFKTDQSGATLIEYGIGMLIAIIVGGAALGTLVDQVENNFDAACKGLVDKKVADACKEK